MSTTTTRTARSSPAAESTVRAADAAASATGGSGTRSARICTPIGSKVSRSPSTLPPENCVETSTPVPPSPGPPTSAETPGTAVTASATARARSSRLTTSRRRPLSLDPLGRLLVARGFRLDVNVVDLDVHLDDVQAGHPLDLPDHVAANGFAGVDDALAVPGDDVEVDRRLAFADLDRHALGGGLAAARDEVAQLPDPAGHAAAHREDTGDVARGQAGDLRHHAGRDAGVALLGDERDASR